MTHTPPTPIAARLQQLASEWTRKAASFPGTSTAGGYLRAANELLAALAAPEQAGGERPTTANQDHAAFLLMQSSYDYSDPVKRSFIAAADRIDTLEAENARLREALQLFITQRCDCAWIVGSEPCKYCIARQVITPTAEGAINRFRAKPEEGSGT